MGYDFYDERSGSGRSRSRKKGQAKSRENLSPGRNRTDMYQTGPSRSTVQEIPPPGGWDSSGSQPRSSWSHSERQSQKPVLELDPSLQNGGRGGSKTKRRIITMIIAECFALLFIFGYGYWARTWNRIQRIDDWIPEEIQNQNFSVDLPQYEKQKGHWGIYVFGVDSRGSNVGKDTHSDVNIICDINHDTGEIRLVSVFRDSYLNINEKNEYNKINQAYFTGGPSEAAKALNKNLDLNIVDYVTFNWKAVADGINLLGGVDMEISRAEFAYINSFITETVQATGVYSQHLKGPGLQHLDGVQAVAYGRLRLMDTDYARTERQRKVIKAAFEKAKAADLSTLNQLAMLLFPQVATSVDLQDIIQLLGNVGKYHIGETGGFPFARGDANMGRKGACVIPQTLESNVTELHQFLYGQENYTPSESVKTISAKISSDTGMYNQGVSIHHVSTSGGSVPRPAKQPETEKPKATKAAVKTEEDGGNTKETKENGENAGEETSGNGNTQGTRETEGERRPTSTLYPDEPRTPARPKTAEQTSPVPSTTAAPHPGNTPSTTVPNVPYPGSLPQENEHGNTPASQDHPSGSSTNPSNTAVPPNGNGPSSINAPSNGNGPSSTNIPSGTNGPSTNMPSNANAPTSGNVPNTPNTPNVPSPPGSSNPGQQPQNTPGTSPAAPNGPTSVIVPDNQVISYEGPPG